jgi:hypothetical protein
MQSIYVSDCPSLALPRKHIDPPISHAFSLPVCERIGILDSESPVQPGPIAAAANISNASSRPESYCSKFIEQMNQMFRASTFH